MHNYYIYYVGKKNDSCLPLVLKSLGIVVAVIVVAGIVVASIVIAGTLLFLVLLTTLVPGLAHAAGGDRGKEKEELRKKKSRRTIAPAAHTEERIIGHVRASDS